MASTLTQIGLAEDDEQLKTRVIRAARLSKEPDAALRAEREYVRILDQPVGSGATLATLYEYAWAATLSEMSTMSPPPSREQVEWRLANVASPERITDAQVLAATNGALKATA